MVDWGLDGDDQENEDDYTDMIQKNIIQDKMQEMKQLGGGSDMHQYSSVLNYKSVKLFELSRFYHEAKEAQQYLQMHEE